MCLAFAHVFLVACLPACLLCTSQDSPSKRHSLSELWGGALFHSNELSSIPLKGKDPAIALGLFIHWPVIGSNTCPGWRGGELRWGPGACCYSAQKPTCPTCTYEVFDMGTPPLTASLSGAASTAMDSGGPQPHPLMCNFWFPP